MRGCTCHPDDAPVPCQRKYALTDCLNASRDVSHWVKFWRDYKTHRDLHRGGVVRAIVFALRNPQFPKWEDVKSGRA
jgi:hypothetical protein